MTPMDCTGLAAAAPELALDLLDGRERADALAHLDRCGACQQLMRDVAADADLLLLLAPSAEPPPDFSARVVGSLTRPAAQPPTTAAPTPRRRPGLLAGLAAAACLAVAALVWGVGGSAPPAPATADMRTPAGDVVGSVVVQQEPAAALFLTMPDWADQIDRYGEPGDTYALRIGRSGEAPRRVPLYPGDDGSWAVTLEVDPGAITDVAVVDSDGDVWCEAEL